mmetsp:Transcript_1245/g.4884  ORF Transcript_1245/g.4884 Transcript_1245/m.4884 type:complete len:235 (+) Transcript_1245:785-1489(+)
MRDMTVTASRGNFPAADSPESITASVPSRTALATSAASARVGRGFLIMDSSIWVAVMAVLPAWLQAAIIIFWARKTFSVGISIPRSPRATMMPSARARISGKLSRPSWFSILAMIRMPAPAWPRASRMTSMSEPFLTKEAAMKSTPWGTAKFTRSSSSLAVMVGRSTMTPGRFMFLRSPSSASLRTVTMTPSSRISSTTITTEPSAARMTFPGTTDLGRLAYEQQMVSASPSSV